MWSLNKSRRCFLGGRKSRPPADLLMLGDIRRDIIYIDWIHVRRDRKDIMLMKMAEGTSYQNPVVWTFKKASGTARLMTDHKPLLHAPPCWLSFDHLQDQWGTEEKKHQKIEKRKKNMPHSGYSPVITVDLGANGNPLCNWAIKQPCLDWSETHIAAQTTSWSKHI